MNAARDLTLTNGEFQSYYVRNAHQPISGSAEFIFKITPTNDGPVTLTLPAGKIQHGLDTSPALTYSFIYDTIAPSFSDALNSYTIPYGDALPTLTCTDVDHDSNSSTFDAVPASFDSYALGTRDAIYTCTDPAGNSVSHTAAITVVPANNVTVKEFDVGDIGYRDDFKRYVVFNFTLNEPLDLGLQGFLSGGSFCNSVFKTDIPDDPATSATEGCIFLDNTIKAPNSELIIGYELTILRIPDSGPFTFTIPAGLGPETSGIRTAKQSHTFEYVTGQYITLTPSPVNVFTNAKPVIFNIKSDQYIKDILSYGIISDNGPVTFARDSSDPENTKLIRLLGANLPFTNAFTITSNPASDGTVTLSMPSISNIGPFGNSTKPLSFSYVYDTTDPTFATFDSIYYIPVGSASYDLPTIRCEDANTDGSFDADIVSGTVVTTNLNLQKVTYSCTDKAGNSATAEVSFQVRDPITVELRSGFSGHTKVNQYHFQIIFSEPVTSLQKTDFIVSGPHRTFLDLVHVSPYTSATLFFADIVHEGELIITLKAGSVQSRDVAGFVVNPTSFTIIYDKTPPKIIYSGNDVTINQGDTFTPLTAVCKDNIDNSRDIKSSSINTDTAGEYAVTFTCSDRVGNISTPLSIVVNVLAPPEPNNVPPKLFKPAGSFDNSIHRVVQNQLYVDPYFKCVDDVDGEFDATRKDVRYSSTVGDYNRGSFLYQSRTPLADNSVVVDTSVAVNTSYDVRYSCTDRNGNVSVERPHKVFVIIVSELNPISPIFRFDTLTVKSMVGEDVILPPSKCSDPTISGYLGKLLPRINTDLPDGTVAGTFTVEASCTSDSRVTALRSVSFIIEDVPQKKKKSGSSDDWHKKPTFGQSHLTHKQIVDNGFSFNGHDLTITDNWHTDFLLTSSIIGDTNTVTIKTYSADPLKWVDLHLGVPRQGGFSEAESHINLVVSRNYTNPVDYTIDEINHYQKENLIDESDTTASVNKVKCQSTDNDEKCYEFTILFTVNAPLMDNVVAISAMDEKRRQHVTYINEGVEFTGESLLDPHTAQLMEKLGNQYDATIIELTQQDRRYNVWEDQHGYLWSQNEYGTWMQTTHPDFERFQDGISNVMTRQNSNFASLIEHERQKALLVFDSSNIASQVGDYFAYDYSDIDRDTSKLEKYYLELQIENQKAQQYTNKN